MPIHFRMSPRIMGSIATLYNDVNRVIMEFVDNSLDSAEAFFDHSDMKYSRGVLITVRLAGANYRDGKITITDNCTGIERLAKVVESVGDSEKKAQAWTNGQFGYGIYSFMAMCSKLDITTKITGGRALLIPINRSQFNEKHIEDVSFPDPKVVSNFPHSSGTEVALTGFDKESWKQIDIEIIKGEIERHFELLLSRPNLKIQIIDQHNMVYKCETFDYNKYEGDQYDDKLIELGTSTGGRYKKEHKIILKQPIHIFIKVTKGQTINKFPVFVSKGRRIGEIKDIRSFRSAHKGDLWGHPNVTGYIDVGDFLEPTIARTDFRNTPNTKALFEKLIELEPLIRDVVDQVNKDSEERHYKELEDQLNAALSKLAKMDLMNFRTEYLSGKNINLASGGGGQELEGGGPGSGSGPRPGTGPGSRPWAVSGTIPVPDPNKAGELTPSTEEGDGARNKEKDNPFEDSEFKGEEKKKSGFNIRIVEDELLIDSETNEAKRSELFGGQIRIYKKHPDFMARVHESNKGSKKITQRLITYLAGEITVHYKDKFHLKMGQPEYNKNLFIGLVEFIYKFEEMLKGLSGRNLSDISGS